MWRQVKYTVGGSSALTITTDTHVYTGKKMMAGRLSILYYTGVSILYYTGPVLMMLPPCCGWSVCSIVVCYKDTAHTFFLRREIEKITSSDYSVFGTGFSIVVGALFLIFFFF